MFKVLRDWIQRYFSDEEAVVLAVLLFLAFTAVLTLGGMLAPVLAGMVLAYLMQGLVVTLERLRVPGGVAVGLVFALFMGVLMLAAGMGSRVVLETEGPDVVVSLDAFVALVSYCFGERGNNADPSSVA